MAEAKRDQNNVPTLIAASSVDGSTPTLVYADPNTHRLLVDGFVGGSVGGASNLNTVGAVPYVASAGVLTSESNFLYNSATTELTITKAGGNWERLFLTNTTANQGALLRFTNPTTNVDVGIFGSPNSGWLVLRQNSVIGMAMAPTTRNVVIGSATPTDDGTNRLQVAGSVRVAIAPAFGDLLSATTAGGANVLLTALGSGNARLGTSNGGGFELAHNSVSLITLGAAGVTINNPTPTTGVTQLVVRAGAGQGGTNLTTWQNSGGSTVAAVTSGGNFLLGSSGYFETASGAIGITQGTVNLGSGALFAFGNAAGYLATKDASISRHGANAIQVGNGGSNANGDLLFRNSFMTGQIFLNRNSAAVAITGSSAGAAEINNQTIGQFRDLYLRGIRPVGVTVANLPAAAGNTGMMCTVTDANATTIGTTVAGGGANTVLVWSNGTNWRIFAN